MDMDKFIGITDKSLIDRFEKEGEIIQTGTYDEYLKLDTTDEYKRRQAEKAKEEEEESKDGVEEVKHSER
jgi:hypothetical protein